MTEEPEIPENKTASIGFKNPEEVEMQDSYSKRHNHKQEYYEALHYIRNYLGRDTNMAVGEWLVALKKAHYDDDLDEAIELMEKMIRGYTDKQIEITLKEENE